MNDFPIVNGFIRNSLKEYDGHISSILFFGGCNFRCHFCYNWKFFNKKNDVIMYDDIFAYWNRTKEFIDGVVLTGGEPTLHDIYGLCKMIKSQYGFDLKLHTNGTNYDKVRRLVEDGLVDCIAFDFKAPFDRYKDVVNVDGIDVDMIKMNFQFVIESGIQYEFHTTLCPNLLTRVDLECMEKYLTEIGSCGKWYIQHYIADDVYNKSIAGEKSTTTNDVMEVTKDMKYVRLLIV